MRSVLARAVRRLWPYSRATMERFSRPVNVSSTAADWPARPMRRRMDMGSRVTSWPSRCSDPESGCNRVATVRMKVVLPAPLGPRMATT